MGVKVKRKIVAGKGKGRVEIGGGLETVLNRMINGSLKTVVGPMEDTRDVLLEAARTEFPKRTGRARAGFEGVLRLDPVRGTVETAIINDVPYIYYVRFRRASFQRSAKAPQAWGKVVVKPGKKLAKQLAEEIGEDLARLGRGR